jgi:pSer/pThr/pTyr-binding forkhead associated (FHA) protein
MSELALFLVRIGFVAVLWIFVLSLLSVIRADLYGRRVISRLTKQRAPQLAQAAPVAELDIEDSDAFEPTHIQMLTGRNAGLRIDLEDRKEIVIGRSPGADLVIADEFASNMHSKLVAVGNEWVLQDLNSTNGTFLDGKRVTTPMTMRAGATVRIGTTTFDLR